MNPAVATTLQIGKRTVLGVADLYLDLVFLFRRGARAVPRTRRITFSSEVRERVRVNQGRHCIYCGVTLNRTNFQVDHIYPVEHGGSNEESNLQATCGSCNARKGVQTDREFRQRYRSVLPGNRRPPTTRIPQSRFEAITQQTTQAETTRQRRRAVYITPARKVVTGSLAGGAIVGIGWYMALTSLFGVENVLVEQIALWSGLAIAGLIATGLILRGKLTGRMDEQ